MCTSVKDLKQRIKIAVASAEEDRLRSAWNELHYRTDICRLTKGTNIEHFEISYTEIIKYVNTCKYFGYISNTSVSIKC
jgi:hypothetical protein